MLRDFVGEARVAARPLAQMDTVDPHVAVHVDAVELEPGLSPPPRSRREAKRLPVPADPRREIPHAPAVRRVTARRALDAPIVRQVDAPPRVIVEFRLLGSSRITEREAPTGVHGQARSWTGGLAGERQPREHENHSSFTLSMRAAARSSDPPPIRRAKIASWWKKCPTMKPSTAAATICGMTMKKLKTPM